MEISDFFVFILIEVEPDIVTLNNPLSMALFRTQFWYILVHIYFNSSNFKLAASKIYNLDT